MRRWTKIRFTRSGGFRKPFSSGFCFAGLQYVDDYFSGALGTAKGSSAFRNYPV